MLVYRIFIGSGQFKQGLSSVNTPKRCGHSLLIGLITHSLNFYSAIVLTYVCILTQLHTHSTTRKIQEATSRCLVSVSVLSHSHEVESLQPVFAW